MPKNPVGGASCGAPDSAPSLSKGKLSSVVPDFSKKFFFFRDLGLATMFIVFANLSSFPKSERVQIDQHTKDL